MSSAEYGFLSRLMHRVALGSPAVLRAMMQMEQGKWKSVAFDPEAVSPVFIAGLARSGSTLLLNRLAASGEFSCSTYRHMPFVLAPNLWSGTSGRHRRQSAAVERAHGDGMKHSADSEEAFEEVFWRAVEPGTDAPMLPWLPVANKEMLAQFRRFQISVIKAEGAPRYLSKNNNNVVRIPTLLKVADTARVVVPFRDPAGFVGSTLAQHQRFLDQAKADPFAQRYMAWLGHFEFGPLFRPFAAPGLPPPPADLTPEYLWRYWIAVYGALLKFDDPRLHFFDYDAFCSDPAGRLAALVPALALRAAPLPPDQVHPPRPYDQPAITDEIRAGAAQVHKALMARALK